MKRFFMVIFALILGLNIIPAVCAEDITEVDVYVDGNLIDSDQPAIIYGDRTMVPIRAICEAMGLNVKWDEANSTVHIEDLISEVSLVPGSEILLKRMLIEDVPKDEYKTMDTTPIIVNGRTLIPVRAVAEAFFADVKWDSENKRVYIERKYDGMERFENGYAKIRKNGKWGFIDESGKIVVKPEYDSVWKAKYADYFGGTKGDEHDLILKNGKVISMNSMGVYDNINYEDNGFFKVEKDKKNGYIDENENVVIPVIYDNIYYVDGIFCAEKGGKWGCMNKNGEIIIPFIYDKISQYIDGMVVVIKDGKCGCVNKKGETVIPIVYEAEMYFQNGVSGAFKDGKMGYINMKGETVIPFIYDGGSLAEGNMVVVGKSGKVGVVNFSGDIIIPFIYDYISYLRMDNDTPDGCDYFFEVAKGVKRGILNFNGEEIIPIICDKIYTNFGESTPGFKAQKENKWEYVDINGHIVIPFTECVEMEIPNEGLAKLRRGEKWGFVDTEGNIVIPCIYNSVFSFDEEGQAIVRKDNKVGIINRKGETVVPFTYDYIGFLYDGLRHVKIYGKQGYLDAKHGYLNEKGEVALPITYTWGSDFKNGYAVVADGVHDYVLINTAGEKIWIR